MGSGDDEAQSEEIEVLQSIYPSELEVVSVAPRTLKISLVPHAPGGDENHVAIALVALLPSNYPSSVPPELSIEIQKGLGQKQGDELKALADRTAGADVGMPTIFTVCEALKEWMCDNNVAGQDGSMYSEMLRREQKKDSDLKKKEEKKAISKAADMEVAEKSIDPEEEERIRKRQAGQPVTVESFNAWKAKFEEEIRVQAALFGGPALGTGTELRLTGKQMFMLNKAGLLDGDDLVAAAESEEVAEGDLRKASVGVGVGVGDDDQDEDDQDDEDWEPSEGDEDDDDDDDDEEDCDDEDES